MFKPDRDENTLDKLIQSANVELKASVYDGEERMFLFNLKVDCVRKAYFEKPRVKIPIILECGKDDTFRFNIVGGAKNVKDLMHWYNVTNSLSSEQIKILIQYSYDKLMAILSYRNIELVKGWISQVKPYPSL